MHVQIWGDMLSRALQAEGDIPTKWADYWSFWCDKVQPAHPQGHRPAHLRPSASRWVSKSTELVPVVLHLSRNALTSTSCDENGKLPWSTIPRSGRAWIGALKD